MTDPFSDWLDQLERRHTQTFTFQEVRRAVQALSVIYVENRDRMQRGAPLATAGKRAAFAMFYGPLHFLLVREIVRALGAAALMPETLVDLGCGTGVAGAAWALEADPRPKLIGIDRNAWALDECCWTYRRLGLGGTTRAADIANAAIPSGSAVIAAFTVNELPPPDQERLLERLMAPGVGPVLIVEPIARPRGRWWPRWTERFRAAGGRDDEWRFPIRLPERLRLMDRAAGLDHRELTGRSLWLPGTRATLPGQ